MLRSRANLHEGAGRNRVEREQDPWLTGFSTRRITGIALLGGQVELPPSIRVVCWAMLVYNL